MLSSEYKFTYKKYENISKHIYLYLDFLPDLRQGGKLRYVTSIVFNLAKTQYLSFYLLILLILQLYIFCLFYFPDDV